MPQPAGNQPKTAGIAIWSLVLGIMSLACLSILTAIPGVICGHVALSRIKRSGGSLSGQGLAIAGLITGYLGIAWAIIFIPLLIAIAVPNFIKAREVSQENACINNLRMIDAAKNEWALENNKTTNDTPTGADLDKYIMKTGGFNSLHCPAGGTYTIGRIGVPPTCSVPGHELPQTQ
jgi:hypothetical protein